MTQKHIGAARGAARAGASGDPKATLQLAIIFISSGAKLHSYRLSRKGILIELAISRSSFTQGELWNAKFLGTLNDLLAL